MTATQITGGSVRYTVPSNYQSGKDGCEVTIHYTVAEGDGANCHSMGDMARTEALRLAIGRAASVGMPANGTPSPSPIGPIATTAVSPSEVVVADPAVEAVTIMPNITDADLRDAANHHSQRLLNAAKDQVSYEVAARKISAEIAKYVLPPKTLYTIDQAQRRAFLAGLAAIQ